MKAIAVDGPGGAGKSTISKRLAKQLGYIYVDTGALYRAIGLYSIERGVPPRDERQVAKLLGEITVDLRFVDGAQRVFLNENDVTDLIRTEPVSMAASAISSLAIVRNFLMSLQRDLAKHNNVIMDGRDIGTVVLPDADVKIFLTASCEDRAKRRYDELAAKGVAADYESVLADLKKRDADDSSREVCPLRPAEDAIVIDTTGNTLEESVALLTATVKERI